jgi:plastocyanin
MKFNKQALIASTLMLMAICVPVYTAQGANLNAIYPPPPQYVDINNNAFNPDNITVPLNTTVTWSNHDKTEETVTATDGSFDSGNITPGGYQYRYIFLQPGWYEYYSRDHPSMRGTVIVKTANGNIPPRPQQATPKAPGPAAPQMNVSANATKPAPSNMTAKNMSASATGKSVSFGLIAKNIAFNTSTIMVPAGANVIISFDNQDQGIPHNFAVYQSSAAKNAIFTGKIVTGPAKATYTFTAPSTPGTYYFQCNVHPTQMNGQFIVEPSSYSGPFTK